MILDVGCGSKPTGDINIDISFEFKDYANRPDIIASATYLPFKNETFEEVRCFHTLEHVNDHIKALKEMFRVLKTGGHLHIKVPHRFSTSAKDKPRTHVRFFDKKWFMKSFGKRIVSITLDHEHRPIPLIGLLWFTRHNEIDVVIKK